VEELIVQEETMLGFWMQGTDCKWATPETQREKGTEWKEHLFCWLNGIKEHR
jgi:hypothetical protein